MASESSSSEKLSGVKHPSDSYGWRPAGDAVVLTVGDVEMLVGLEQEYSNTVNESEIDIQARIIWARHSALISIVFMILYLVVGIAFFRTQTDWDLPNATLFAVYTAISAGYGHLDIPKTPLFQIFDIFYIIIGIAGLAFVSLNHFSSFRFRHHSPPNHAIRQKSQDRAWNSWPESPPHKKMREPNKFLSISKRTTCSSGKIASSKWCKESKPSFETLQLGDAWQSRSHCWQFCWLVTLQLVRLKAGPLSKAYTLLSFQ
jgi:uncharacterized membrane protein YuzA (DUF378 family)